VGAAASANGRSRQRTKPFRYGQSAAPWVTICWQVWIRLVWVAPVAAVQLAVEIMLQTVAGSPIATQQLAAFVQTAQLAVPEPPAAPLVPPVPVMPPVPVLPEPPVPVVPPVPVPLEPPEPVMPTQPGKFSRQASNCAQSDILLQFEMAVAIALALVQVVPPVPPVPEVLEVQDVMQAAIAALALASARHICVFTQVCSQIAVGSVDDELDPQPCTAPSANPTTRNDPITAETVFLDIARYLLLVLWKAGRYHASLAVPISCVTSNPRFH
jgi:hypothetical protein